MDKVDTVNGAFSSADMEGRWATLAEKLRLVRDTTPQPLARLEVSGCDLEFWPDDSQFTVSALRDGQIVGYLCVVRKDELSLAGDVGVRKSHRRQGIATAMYDFAETVLGVQFLPCTPHSAHAAAFWSNRLSFTEEYRAGFEAGRNGLSVRINPLDLGVAGRQKWNVGYEDGRDEFVAPWTQREVEAALRRDRAALGLSN